MINIKHMYVSQLDEHSDKELDVAHDVASRIPELYYQDDEELKQEYELMIKMGLPVIFFNTPRDAQSVRTCSQT